MFPNLLMWLKPIRGMPLWLRYAATAAIVLACFGIRWVMRGVDESGHLPLFLMFVPAVIIASFLFDRGSGFFAVALSSLLGLYFFVEPAGTFSPSHPGNLIRLVTFVIIGVLTASIIEALRKTVDELADSTTELNNQRQQLALSHAQLVKVDEQKTLLLSDLNHRVKNHLQSIVGMISLSSRKAESFEEAQTALLAASARLQVLGRVYDRLQLRDNGAIVDARSFLTTLCADLKSTIGELRPISLRVDVDPMELDSSRAVSLGLIVNELVTNCLKYAFPDGREGDINVSLKPDGAHLCLTVADNGIGIEETSNSSVGQRLVRALARQLGGHADWIGDGGTTVRVVIQQDQLGSNVY